MRSIFRYVKQTAEKLVRGRARTAGYDSTAVSTRSTLFNWDERPPFSLLTAELMMYDPKVTIALGVRDGLLMNAEVDITDGRPEVMDFVRDQWDSIWGCDADKLLRTKQFGYSGFEMMYRPGRGRWSGRVVYDSCRDFHPRDVRPLVKDGSKIMGISVNNVKKRDDHARIVSLTHGGGKIPIWRPKSLWLTFGSRYGSLFGESLLEHAYAPWHEKHQKGGALKLRQLRMMKDAWMGHVIRYPNELIRDATTGEVVTWKDIARDLVENAMSGAAIGLPSQQDQNGNYRWDLEPPTAVEGATEIFSYADNLDGEILEGLQMPAEVLEALSSGSGFSGRSIPFVALLAILQAEFNRYVQAIDDQVLRELVRINFGVEGRYVIKPKKMIETIGKLMGGMDEGGSDEKDKGGGDPQSGLGMPGQVRPQGGTISGGMQTAHLATGSGGGSGGGDSRARALQGGGNGQPRLAPASGAIVEGVYYAPGSWIPPKAVQFASALELEALDAADAIRDAASAAGSVVDIDAPEPDEATMVFGGRLRRLGPIAMQFADGARAPKGGVTVNGKEYKGGQWIPGSELQKASPEERAAVEGSAQPVNGNPNMPKPSPKPKRQAKPSRQDQTLSSIAERELFIDTLETQGSDSLDFHDVGVESLKDALEAAYRAGGGGGDPSMIIGGIASSEFDIDTLESQGRDHLDFHDLSVAGIKSALEAAYLAGSKKKVNRKARKVALAPPDEPAADEPAAPADPAPADPAPKPAAPKRKRTPKSKAVSGASYSADNLSSHPTISEAIKNPRIQKYIENAIAGGSDGTAEPELDKWGDPMSEVPNLRKAAKLAGVEFPEQAQWEVAVVPLDSLTPTQDGEDYENDSSKAQSEKIDRFNGTGRPEDYAPVIAIGGKVLDGNHRHAAHKIAGLTEIPVLRPKA